MPVREQRRRRSAHDPPRRAVTPSHREGTEQIAPAKAWTQFGEGDDVALVGTEQRCQPRPRSGIVVLAVSRGRRRGGAHQDQWLQRSFVDAA